MMKTIELETVETMLRIQKKSYASVTRKRQNSIDFFSELCLYREFGLKNGFG